MSQHYTIVTGERQEWSKLSSCIIEGAFMLHAGHSCLQNGFFAFHENGSQQHNFDKGETAENTTS